MSGSYITFIYLYIKLICKLKREKEEIRLKKRQKH